MGSNWMFALVAGVSVLSAACQPYDGNDTPLVQPPRPQALERESRKFDERLERLQARWNARIQRETSDR